MSIVPIYNITHGNDEKINHNKIIRTRDHWWVEGVDNENNVLDSCRAVSSGAKLWIKPFGTV